MGISVKSLFWLIKLGRCWSPKSCSVSEPCCLVALPPLMAGPEGGLPMQVVNWEGIGLPRPFLSFIARGARAGGGMHNLGCWLGWVVSHRRKNLASWVAREKWVT